MYYEITDQVKEIELKNRNEDTLTVGIITLDQLKELYKKMGFSHNTVLDCEHPESLMQNRLVVYESYCFGIISTINSKNVLGTRDQIGIYIKKNLILIVDIFDEDKSTLLALNQVLKTLNISHMTLGKFIYYYFRALIDQDNISYDALQKRVDTLDKEVLDGAIKNFQNELSRLRRELLILHNYYEQLSGICESIQLNDNDLFSEDDLRYIHILSGRIQRSSDNIELLREFTSQVRESYQSQQDYNLNSIMKMFTIVTTLFLPLTLIVGWYGMNFHYMPELTWKYGYFFVIGLSILTIIICILWFKKKKFF